MVEQHIYSASTTSDNQFLLATYESEAGAKFKKETGNILFQRCFKLFFLIISRNGYETKIIIVLCYFLSHPALSLRQILRKITDSLTLRLV